MPKFTITQVEAVCRTAEIEATSLEVAKRKLENGDYDGDLIDTHSGMVYVSIDHKGHRMHDAGNWPSWMRKLTCEVCVYNGQYFEGRSNPQAVHEYSGTGVPVTIEQIQGVRLRLGALDTCAGVLVERQTDRWMIAVHADDDGEPDLLVFVMDDGHVLATPDCQPNPNVEFVSDVPRNLPWRVVRYKDVALKPGDGDVFVSARPRKAKQKKRHRDP